MGSAELDQHIGVLEAYVKKHFSLSVSSLAEFLSPWKTYHAERKEVLTHQGEQERYLYFVLEGVQRVYALNSEGKEATLIFTYAPSFGGVLNAMMTEQPSQFFYETLTSSSFLRAPALEIKRIMLANSEIAQMINFGVSRALGGVLDRLAELQLMSSEEKFRSLLKRSPHILSLVPHKYLASYLGIDATNFSKLMNRVKI